jgi:hypothetical protein
MNICLASIFNREKYATASRVEIAKQSEPAISIYLNIPA